jgi:ornithine cyclodeaminase/alanine dehydrogenase-like protein (mu-crystallin family)
VVAQVHHPQRSEHRAPIAILDAAEITAARTAALTALCIRRLAPGASKIAIVGLGVQARAHEKTLKSIEPETEITAVDATGEAN